MTATNKITKAQVGFENSEPGRIKLWPVRQPLNHEFLTEAEFGERYEVSTEPTPPSTTT